VVEIALVRRGQLPPFWRSTTAHEPGCAHNGSGDGEPLKEGWLEHAAEWMKLAREAEGKTALIAAKRPRAPAGQDAMRGYRAPSRS